MVFSQIFQDQGRKFGWLGTASFIGLAYMPYLLDGTLTSAWAIGCRAIGWMKGNEMVMSATDPVEGSVSLGFTSCYHLGENDLLEEKGVVLSRIIIADLLLLHNMFPSTMLL